MQQAQQGARAMTPQSPAMAAKNEGKRLAAAVAERLAEVQAVTARQQALAEQLRDLQTQRRPSPSPSMAGGAEEAAAEKLMRPGNTGGARTGGMFGYR